MVDVHAHLNFAAFDKDRSLVIERMVAAGVGSAIVVGVDYQSSVQAVQLARQYPSLYSAVGLHPGDVAGVDVDKAIEQFDVLIKQSQKIVAIGEIGLDYKVFDSVEPDRALQHVVFLAMIDLANRHHLPIVVHSRMAEAEVLEVLREHPARFGGVIHCFSSTYEIARRALDLGYYISFTGMVTYPKNEVLRAVAARLPQTNVCIETDCPFLPPQSIRGQRNEPAYVVAVAEVLASLWGTDVKEVDRVTTENAQRLFKFA